MTREDMRRIVEEHWDREVEAGCGFTLPALEQDDHYQRLRQQWLPYSNDDLRRERLASGMSIRVEGSVGFELHDELSDLSGAAKRARLSCPVQQEHRSPPIGPGEDNGQYQ